MKVMFLSDIHGMKTNLQIVKDRFEKENFDKIIVLGDLCYVGPKNKPNENYDVPAVLEFLNSMKDKIICIQGNCDSEVDDMVCEFPIIRELGMISIDGNDIYITHGHIYHENNWEYNNSILVYGHYHIPFIKEKGSNIFINPGSISFPKGEFQPSYMVYENSKFTICDIFGNIIAEKVI